MVVPPMKAALQRTRTFGIIRLKIANARASKPRETKKGPLPATKPMSSSPQGNRISQSPSQLVLSPNILAMAAIESIVTVVAPIRKNSTRKSR